MNINKSKLTIEEFAAIETEMIAIKARIDSLCDMAFIGEAYRLGRDLAALAGNVQGLAYMTHPQSEWTGGDSSDPANTVIRFPHIAALD